MDFDLILKDRIEAIKLVNNKYNLLDNSYVAFSGGKDSLVLHYLIDMALPNNNIPRVFVNTGIEFNFTINFIKDIQLNDNRIIIVSSNNKVIPTLNNVGYPFKSKFHSHIVDLYQHKYDLTLSVKKYLNGEYSYDYSFQCPENLKYQFSPEFKLRISDKCCLKFKKEPMYLWSTNNDKSIALTGIRKSEGGRRKYVDCLYFKNNQLKRVHFLSVVDDDFINTFIKSYNITLNPLYLPPFNFRRTGCKGCPFNAQLKDELNILQQYLPCEYKQCYSLFGKVYDEYKRIGFRL